MLVPVSTLLARAKRHHEGVPFFQAASAEIIEALSQEASGGKSLGIIIDATVPATLSLGSLVAVAKAAAGTSLGQVAVLVVVAASQESAQEAISCQAPAILFQDSADLARTTLRTLSHWAVRVGGQRGCEVVGTLSGLVTLAKISTFAQETGVQALFLPIGVVQHGKALVSPAYLKEIGQAAKLPIIAQPLSLSAAQRSQAVRSGITGFSYDHDLLSEAYTAGLRTGLRNRAQHNPAVYQASGMQAVRQAARSYLHD